MTSDETSQRFSDENLPDLKSIGENAMTNKRLLQKQPQLRSSSIFPPNLLSGTTTTNSTLESLASSTTNNSTIREVARHSLIRNNLPLLSPRSSFLQIANNALHRRATRYDHIHPKIDTGLPRIENLTQIEKDTYQLGPTRPINWCLLKQELNHDTQIRAQAKRIQFNTDFTYPTQLTNLVRSKVKAHISSLTNSNEERYKILVQLHVFQTMVGGLHIASRCLWNPLTDNSITIKMQGVDCDLLIIVFFCYTD